MSQLLSCIESQPQAPQQSARTEAVQLPPPRTDLEARPHEEAVAGAQLSGWWHLCSRKPPQLCPLCAEIGRLELQQLVDTVEGIERTHAEIYSRWFETPDSSGGGDELASSDNPTRRTTSRSAPPPRSPGEDASPRLVTHDAGRVCARMARCSAAEDVVSPQQLAEACAGRSALAAARRASDAVLTGAGSHCGAAFDPVAAVEAVTEAVIDDIVAAHVREMLRVCDHAADGLFAAEFA